MSVEKLQLVHEDYIRLTERFKALWTFHQFLRGICKTFSSQAPGYGTDFNGLYEEVKAVGADLGAEAPESLSRRIRESSARLDALAAQLRETDRNISPSLVRRFFDRIRPQDEKIAFYLLRYYFSQPDVDEDVIDKVDFLSTYASMCRPEPDATASRPRSAIRQLFESVTAASVWPRIETGMTPAIVRAFDELASDVTQAREFEQLLTERLLKNARTMKRRVATGLADPDILTAVAWCNLTTRSVFHRLYEREERRLDEATGRIVDLERELTRGGDEVAPPQEFRRFRESRVRFDQLASERNLRAQHIMELKLAIGDVLEKFDISGLEAEDIDEALELVEEVDANAEDEGFWRPCLDRILAPVGRASGATGAAGGGGGLAPLKLESWELSAARRTLEAGEPPTEADRTLLRAAALRVRAEEQAEALRRAEAGIGSSDLVRAARATLARCESIENALEQIASESRGSDEARSWNRTRHRLRGASSALWLETDRASGRA